MFNENSITIITIVATFFSTLSAFLSALFLHYFKSRRTHDLTIERDKYRLTRAQQVKLKERFLVDMMGDIKLLWKSILNILDNIDMLVSHKSKTINLASLIEEPKNSQENEKLDPIYQAQFESLQKNYIIFCDSFAYLEPFLSNKMTNVLTEFKSNTNPTHIYIETSVSVMEFSEILESSEIIKAELSYYYEEIYRNVA